MTSGWGSKSRPSVDECELSPNDGNPKTKTDSISEKSMNWRHSSDFYLLEGLVYIFFSFPMRLASFVVKNAMTGIYVISWGQPLSRNILVWCWKHNFYSSNLWHFTLGVLLTSLNTWTETKPQKTVNITPVSQTLHNWSMLSTELFFKIEKGLVSSSVDTEPFYKLRNSLQLGTSLHEVVEQPKRQSRCSGGRHATQGTKDVFSHTWWRFL